MFQVASQLPARPLRTMIYGPTRVGKTTSATTWPGPVAFISVAVEGGDMTLRTISQEKKDDGIYVCSVDTPDDMLRAVEEIERNPRSFGTVVIDSISFYSDVFMASLTGKTNKPARIQDWGMLSQHVLRSLTPRLHRLPQHVVWICLEKEKRDEGTGVTTWAGPLLPGESASKLPAMCDLLIHMESTMLKGPNGKFVQSSVFRLVPHGPFIAGGRFGGAFLEGGGVLYPHFGAVYERIAELLGQKAPQTFQPVPPVAERPHVPADAA